LFSKTVPSIVSVFGVEPRRIGGTETFARELSWQLGERGWQSVLCFLSQPSAEVRRFLDLPNIRLEVVENSTNGSRTARRALKAILRVTQPEILHLHFVSFLNLYSWLARMNSVSQVCFTDHHSRPAGHIQQPAPIWKRVAARGINWPLSKVICVSRYGYDCMTAPNLLPHNRFEMIYNGVDLSRVKLDPQRARDFRQRYSIPAERKIVTQVSWIIPEKGITDFLETASLVLKQDRNVQFVLVGDGEQRQQFTEQAGSMGIADHLTWTGMVEDPFGEGVFEAADIVCQFSRWEEVFGWMIAEAMAHRKPIIATRVGGIPEVVEEGVSGFLVDRGDTRTMADSVLRLLNDDALRRRCGRAGQQIVHERFNLRTNVGRLIESYQLESFKSSARPNLARFQEVRS
jgi:glycosyltransferase involved in cell wall biosynthesis